MKERQSPCKQGSDQKEKEKKDESEEEESIADQSALANESFDLRAIASLPCVPSVFSYCASRACDERFQRKYQENNQSRVLSSHWMNGENTGDSKAIGNNLH